MLTILGATSCKTNNGNNGGSKDASEFLPVKALDRDYVHRWIEGNAFDSSGETFVQGPDYGAVVEVGASKPFAIKRLGNLTYQSPTFEEADFSQVPVFSAPFYKLNYGGSEYTAYGHENVAKGTLLTRLLESGRHIQRIEALGMGYVRDLEYPQDIEKLQGRVEFAFFQEYFAMTYEVYSDAAISNANLTFGFTIPSAYATKSVAADGKKAVITNGGSAGFVLVADDPSAVISLAGNNLVFSTDKAEVAAQQLTGFSIKFYPTANPSVNNTYFENLGAVNLSYEQGQPAPMTMSQSYDASHALYTISYSGGMSGSDYFLTGYSDETRRNTYERIPFTISNPFSTAVRVPIRLRKAGSSFSIYGVSPMIRDGDTLEPTGVPVQISKNWHGAQSAPGMPATYPANLWTGVYLHAYAVLEIPANTTKNFEYTCAYSQWGGIAAASHAQLSLAGWGGNTLWDQAALGTNGENITYSPEVPSVMIADVRPPFVAGNVGYGPGNNHPYEAYNWTGNIGGADFMRLTTVEGTQKATEMNVVYSEQSPNLTDVRYVGTTPLENVRFDYNLQFGRTDDMIRHYYTFRFYFDKDTEIRDMTFFNFASADYSKNNAFRKFAYGDDKGVNADLTYNPFAAPSPATPYYNSNTPQKFEMTGENDWFMLYDADDNPGFAQYGPSQQDKDGNLLAVVRSFRADLNGKLYTKGAFNIKNDFKAQGPINPTNQPSFEFTLPSNAPSLIKAGSQIEIVFEYITLPAPADRYFGPAEYMSLSKLLTPEKFNSAQQGLEQARYGALILNVTKGQKLGVYPVKIKAENDAVEFTLKGGLGYTPVTFSGLSGYKNYVLEVKNSNGVYAAIDQSVHGNDFWQTKFDSATGTYQRTYNIQNYSGQIFDKTYEYRLRKVN